MCCKKNEGRSCCMMSNKEKMIPCALMTLVVAFTVAGFIIGHHVVRKGCCKEWDEELDQE